MKRTALASLIVVVLAQLFAPAASAQSSPMTVDFGSVAIAGPTERIVVFVDGTACASVTIDANAPPVALLGTAGQPATCGIAGAEVTFLQFRPTGQQLELFTRTSFTVGGSFEVENWAPQPPGLPLPSYMQAFLDSGGVIEPAGSGNAGLAGEGAGPTLGVLAVALIGVFALAIMGRAMTATRDSN